jgi:hypothetical protein
MVIENAMEKITLRTFIAFMMITAGLTIGGVWGGEILPEAYFKTIASCFIIGLASFLLWATMMVYRFLKKLS